MDSTIIRTHFKGDLSLKEKLHFLTKEHGEVELIFPVHSPLDHYDVDGVQHRPRQRPQRTCVYKSIIFGKNVSKYILMQHYQARE